MEATRLVRREPQATPPDDTATPAGRKKEQTANLSSANIPVDASGNPLPWSQESIVRWARRNGFAKFISAFIQHGIEGYRFYTLRLEEMRGMKIPGVTMQDLIQLNAAIYRLNVACATPANRSHMTGTVRVAPPPPSYRPPANSQPQTYNYASQPRPSNAQILSRPLQPLRPPRPSWTLRQDDPQPTYPSHVQLTSNGMVVRPLRRPPPVPSPVPSPVPPPLPPILQGSSLPSGPGSRAQGPSSKEVPHAINTGVGPKEGRGTRTWGARTGPLPRSPPFRDAQGSLRYGSYRGRNSDHVEADEQPLLRPKQTWAPQRPAYTPATTMAATTSRRRSAVIEMFGESAKTDDMGQRNRPVGKPQPTTAPSAAQTLPMRYHGGNHPHSPYYAHGAAPYRRARTPPRMTHAATYGPRGAAMVQSAGARYPTMQPAMESSKMRAQDIFVPATQKADKRRSSISPVLSALQPGNYHIANVPDESSEDDANQEEVVGPLETPQTPQHVLWAQQKMAEGRVLAKNGLPTINTALYGLRESPCDTGDSIITPLSVVNVLPGMHSESTTPSQANSQAPSLLGSIASMSTHSSRSSISRARMQRHARTPSAPSLRSFPLMEEPAEMPVGRPRSSAYIEYPLVFDAESLPSSDCEVDSLDSHFDLVENAAPLDAWRQSVFSVWDAEEIPEETLMTLDAEEMIPEETLTTLDAEEIPEEILMTLDAEEIPEEILMTLDAEEANGSVESLGVFDAESLASDWRPSSVLVDAYEIASIALSDASEGAVGEASKDATMGSGDGEVDSSAENKSPAGEQVSPTFKVNGMRHVLSYGADFDKTAATLLSSIKTDIAKKMGGGVGPSAPDAAQIAAAIEYHQQKQQQQQHQHPNGNATISAGSERYIGRGSSRLSGLFGFGQRTKSQLSPLGSNPQQQQQQQQQQSPSGAGGLRVVTDLPSLRGDSGPTNELSSSDKRSSSPSSTLPRRWRVPFRQPKEDRGHEGELPVRPEGRRALRRSRHRAGTTSDIETATPQSSTVDRPFSMVESSSSGGSTPAMGRLTSEIKGRASRTRMQSLGDAEQQVVLARREQDTEFTRVSIAGILSGASVAERLVRTLSGEQQQRRRQPVSSGWRFAVVTSEGETQAVESETELWMHSMRTGAPARIVLSRGSVQTPTSDNAWEVRLRSRRGTGSSSWLERSGSSSDSEEICSALPVGRGFVDSMLVEAPLSNPVSPTSARGETDSPSSFVTAKSVQWRDSEGSSPMLGRREADSWTLMFFNKEFVMPLPNSAGQSAAGSQAALGASVEPPIPERAEDSDDLLWGGADPEEPTAGDDDDDALAMTARADLQELTAGDADDALAMAVRADLEEQIERKEELPSTMRFTRGMRATLLERGPSKKTRGARPTADAIGEQLDKYFPDHDLDRPIVQSVPMDPGLLPSSEFHIIVDEDGRRQQQQQREQRKGVGRRKSVRMLVQETRRRGRRRGPEPQAQAQAGLARRKSTKVWGCTPEEIHPRPQPPAIPADSPGANDEIVRRALSLLRKPEPNPQAEKEIVEAAMRCEDSGRAAGSTRAQFVQERALQRAIESRDGSVSDAVRALFAKYGLGPAGVRFQWIRGKLIGKGSFGHVHVAINAGTGEVIAVKQIRLPKALAPGRLAAAVEMMYTEVELLRDLDHANIVQLLGFEVAGGLMSMFLEYVAGGTVQSLVQQHGPLPESVVHSFVAQIAAGLTYLHERGILHRDIKGANILVDETGTCKISDFGISRKANHSQLASGMSKGQRILGTVPFMAPEVARKSEYAAAADIWSLGCVVVQMWSGRQPWDELIEPQVFFKLGRGEAPPIPDDLTEAGLEFCKHCFAPDPQARWTAPQLAQMKFAQVQTPYEYPYC
ncbi:mitogen-activated protein kinase kinase kinase [Coemansia sp. RSA 552]|nr:mitogen-activated protein kinase kinase kinase [Coemansia sp. RSA 552]